MGFDLFNKKKVQQLELELSNLKEKLAQIKLTKEESQYIDLKAEILSFNETIKNKESIIEKLDSDIKIKNDILISTTNKVNDQCKVLNLTNNIAELNSQIQKRKDELNYIEQDEIFQSFGLYKPKYNLMNSDEYKARLEKIRAIQKDAIKTKTAVNYFDDWTLDGSKSKGRAMNNDNIKLILRSFNNECEACINKVKFNNIETIRKRITKSFETLNKLGNRMRISVTSNYLNLKLQELDLAYEYEVKKQEEKEEQKRINEQMREEAKVLKEIEREKEKIKKEEKHFNNAINDINKELDSCNNDNEKEKLLAKLKELNDELEKLKKNKEDITNREKNTRAGYVYVISNIGSFGEDVYKIGMTRRLEPLDRVRELGDASVPFRFDVHAMIFSNDAPALENALHKEFATRSVNKINMKKEFFKVPLSEIERTVKENYNEVVHFTKIAEASEYRQSLEIEKNNMKLA